MDASDSSGVSDCSDTSDSSEGKRMARHLWWRVAYFFFIIHILAFVMIYAATHANE